MRLIVAGGGTAGHIVPILAVLEQLAERDPALEVLFVGTGKQLEREIVQKAGVRYVHISAGKYRRYKRGLIAAALDVKTNTQNFRDLFRVVAGLSQSYRLMRQFKPDVVFMKGSYVGLPVGIAAHRRDVPIVLHNSDTVFDLTNRYLARYAAAVAVGFPVSNYDPIRYPHLIYTGTPLRQTVLIGSKFAAERFFQLDKQKPNILVMGGSIGSAAMNAAVFENLNWLSKEYNVIHLTGEQGIEQARFLAHQLPPDQQRRYQPHAYLHDELGQAYAAAEIVVSRSGATTISELAAWEKPAIVIPYPAAANGEQRTNAEMLARAGAVRLLPEEEMVGRRLVSEIDKLMASPSDRQYLAKNIAKFNRPDAAQRLAELLLSAAQNRQEGKRGATASA